MPDMYDEQYDNKPSTMPIFPRCPDFDDPRWREVAVRSRTQSQTDVKRIPTDDYGTEIATIFVGDTMAIMPEVKYKHYVAARVGYHVGWINFKHVKLMSIQARNRRYLEETKPDIPQYQRPQTDDTAHYQEEDTQPAPAQHIPSYDERIASYQRRFQQESYDQHTVEEDAQPAPRPAPRQPSPIERKDVNRIIDKLKNLGGLFSRR